MLCLNLFIFSDKKTYSEVIEEIKKEVNDLEPYIKGYDVVPTSAFTLLIKLFTLRLTQRQLTYMLSPKSPPFVYFFFYLFFYLYYFFIY